jgi:hypothetical protein
VGGQMGVPATTRRGSEDIENATLDGCSLLPIGGPGTPRADSEGCRSAFRTDVDHDSEVMPISVPN